MARVFVLGSLNADLVIAAERPPRVGETLAGGDLAVYPGGKGANQAVAAARLGARTILVGAAGQDAFGEMLLAAQRAAGVDVSGVARVERPTGVALILRYPSGDNSIVISPGANAAVEAGLARQGLAGIGAGDVLLCQLETPLEAVRAALELARERGATTVLDPAPAKPLPPSPCRRNCWRSRTCWRRTSSRPPRCLGPSGRRAKWRNACARWGRGQSS